MGVLVAFALGFVCCWWVGQVRKDNAARRQFTKVTDAAAYTKLNERSFKDHPDMRLLDELDREWYV